ncbi:MAG: BadF/BadG/BcrA/BcrD ATPase family protein, partial [Microbacterium sp.]
SSWRGELGDPVADAEGLRGLLLDRLGPTALGAPLAVGAHGCENTEQCLALERELRRRGDGPVLVVNDAELMAPAAGLPGAIGMVAGTGSIATARTRDGEMLSAGGWGWLLGDEGSAPALVREAVRAVLARADRDGGDDVLGSLLMAAFDARDGAELALAATQTASPEDWGRHAPLVFDAADAGSTLAVAVVEEAGSALALLADALLVRGIEAVDVVAGGSVIERQPRLQEALRSALAQRRPGIRLTILSAPPVRGAIALARTIDPLTSPSRNGEPHP